MFQQEFRETPSKHGKQLVTVATILGIFWDLSLVGGFNQPL